jgi:hypothetical protein
MKPCTRRESPKEYQTVPVHQLNLLQKFGRFILVGAVIFALAFWGASMFLVSGHDVHHNFAVVRVILKSSVHKPFTMWLQDLETVYLPFFLRQPPLMGCYLIAASLAWLAAFVFDGRVLRKENVL